MDGNSLRKRVNAVFRVLSIGKCLLNIKGFEMKECKWQYDETYDYYDTSCGQVFHFIEGKLKDNNFIHCPYCGRKTKEVNK